MAERIENFYTRLKDFNNRMRRIRSRTVSTDEFKKEVVEIYEAWMTEIRPTLIKLNIKEDRWSRLDESFDTLDFSAKQRVTEVPWLKEHSREITDRFFKEIILNLRNIETPEPTVELMECASFLGLNTNWSIATCSLQLQEVATVLVAKKAKINLERENVEKILSANIPSKDFSFNHQYEAFSKEAKQFGIDMPILTMYLRRMRVKVLHEGYNPEPEEKDSIVSFTIGLLKKLKDIHDRQ